MPDRLIDDVFSGWQQSATLEWPLQGRRLKIVGLGPVSHVVVYAPEHGRFVCVEPVSHATNAVNMQQCDSDTTGLIVLEAGAHIEVGMRLMSQTDRQQPPVCVPEAVRPR